DEATSALDGTTEAEVMKAIDDLSGTISIIIIAHRLSTIENCEKIVELHPALTGEGPVFSDVHSQRFHQ
ncbi:hypothetical protein N9Z03_01295, partial [Akkermansiaceae bacterium]|nr:hypothetical protein [Akkermansiaceae bacterium]